MRTTYIILSRKLNKVYVTFIREQSAIKELEWLDNPEYLLIAVQEK